MEHIFLWPVREWINLIFSATSANFRPKMICSKFKLNDEGMTGSLYYTCHDPLDWSSVQLRFLLLFYFLESSFKYGFILVVLSVYHLILLLFPVNSLFGFMSGLILFSLFRNYPSLCLIFCLFLDQFLLFFLCMLFHIFLFPILLWLFAFFHVLYQFCFCFAFDFKCVGKLDTTCPNLIVSLIYAQKIWMDGNS